MDSNYFSHMSIWYFSRFCSRQDHSKCCSRWDCPSAARLDYWFKFPLRTRQSLCGHNYHYNRSNALTCHSRITNTYQLTSNTTQRIKQEALLWQYRNAFQSLCSNAHGAAQHKQDPRIWVAPTPETVLVGLK